MLPIKITKKKGRLLATMIDTPICDFVEAYIQKHFSRFHMPGHKGTDERFPLLARRSKEQTTFIMPMGLF